MTDWRRVAGSSVLAAVLLSGAAAAQHPDAAGATPRAPAAGRESFALESADGTFRLEIGLLMHADGRFAVHDNGRGITDTFALRRLRPSLRGRLAERFEFFLNPDFAGGTLVVQDAYIDTVFTPALRVRIGKAKAPFGLERLVPASNLLFSNRAFPTALAPNRDIGIQVLGELGGGFAAYMAAVTNGVPDGGSTEVDTGDAKDLSGRMVIRPFARRTGSRLQHLALAFAGSRGRQSGEAALPVFRTALLEQRFFAYGGASADGVRTRYSPQLSFSWKAIGAMAEYVHTRTPVRKGDVRADTDHEAWQVAVSVALTGETVADAGTRVHPRAAFDFGHGHLGAVQLAARYHVLRVSGQALALGLASAGSSRTAEAWTVGVNWYLNDNVRHTLNIERTVFDGGAAGTRPAEEALVVRTQLVF